MASSKKQTPARVVQHLRQLGLRKYPGAEIKSPWPGHLDLAVDDKTFAYLSAPGDPPGLSLKLPLSKSIALALPGSTPTAYGLGKSGWVSMSLDAPHLNVPVEQLEEWLDESYRAQASKKRLRELDGTTLVKAAVRAPAKAKAKGRGR